MSNDEEHLLQLEEQVPQQHSPPAKFPCKSWSISIHSFRIPGEILFCSIIGKESIDSFPTPGGILICSITPSRSQEPLSPVLLLPDPRNPYLQYYLHYEGYKVNTAVPQTNNGRRVQIGTPLTAKDACPFAGFLYIRRGFTSPASTKGGSKAAAKFINPDGGLRIFSNGEVRLYGAITNPQDTKPWIGPVKKIRKPLLFGTNQGAHGSFSDAEKAAWCVDPYKNYCAKVFELYQERDGTGILSSDGSLSRIPFEVIEIFSVGRLVTIRSFNPGDDV